VNSRFCAFRPVVVMLALTATSAWPVAMVAGQPASRPAVQAQQPAPGRQAAEAKAEGELPIRNITLYRSGVGYFERHAVINGRQDVQLKFNTDQINDILKSMVVLDLDGGRIDSVGYGSKAPLERRLGSFAVNVADNPDMATLLGRFRGAPVRVVTLDGPVTGTILGVETRPKASGERQVVQTPYVNLLTDTGIRSLDLTAIASFEILDRELAGELNKALAALAEYRADRIKSVDLSFSGQGERRIVVAYVHEMPVWKTSYRLVLPEHPSGVKPPREAEILTMQGWAIVENTSDEDWENVRLSLVAGQPVSFTMDLYEPLFAKRPEVPVPMVAGVMPRTYQAAVEELRQGDVPRVDLRERMTQAAPAPAARRGGGGQSPFRGGDEEFAMAAALEPDAIAKYAAAAVARGGEVGQVFQYQLQVPVSVARQRSAMLPILTSDIEGRRLSIYNRADNAEHPMRGVQLTNSSGLQLMPGPISVFDGASYAGDAQIGHVPAGDKRLLAYAVDLDVRATSQDDAQSFIQTIRIVNGLIEETLRRQMSTTYTFNNKDQKRPRQILVEHRREGGWDLVAPEKAAETTGELYRFEVAVEPGQAGDLRVVQQRTDRQRYAVTEYNLGTLLAYARDGKASQRVVDAVRKAADMQGEINDLRRRMAVLEQERNTIHQEQNRIRQNMASVGRDSEIYRQYIARFTEQEARLEAIGREREELQRASEAKQHELETYLRNLSVD
jgi:uncharacterized protein (UPF0335 family)